MFHYPALPYAKSSILYFILFYFNLLETDSYYVTQTGLEFMMSHPRLLSAGMAGVHYHV